MRARCNNDLKLWAQLVAVVRDPFYPKLDDDHLAFVDAAFDRHSRSKRARIEATNSMATDVQSEYRHVQESIASTSKNIESFAGRVTSEVGHSH